MSELSCPKCASAMRGYERNRVHVDQCTGCGGLFLDRGELEQLVAAENAWHGQSAAAPPPSQMPPAQPYGQPAAGHEPYGAPPVQAYGQAPRYATSKERKYGYGHGGYGKRKKSFLSELFDG